MDLVFPLQAVGHATKTTVEAVVVGEVGAKDIALATNKSLGYYVDGFDVATSLSTFSKD